MEPGSPAFRTKRFLDKSTSGRRPGLENREQRSSIRISSQPTPLHSYGAHCVEIKWDPEIARLRMNRVVSVIDAGGIINQTPARNQIEGAIVMGVGMALLEETHYDAETGAPVNNNLADYCMAVHADIPSIDLTFLDYPDYV
jgi:CO/xanthine dehydrogenase Mo-binding subunit